METLREYLNSLPVAEQIEYADRCDTKVGYLRKAISTNQKIGEWLVVKLEKESGGKVRCEDIRPDVDWTYLRSTKRRA